MPQTSLLKVKKLETQKQIIVFDLDDTLYEELTYVRSGFMAVAKFISKKCDAPVATIYAELCEEHDKNGRGKIFNSILENYQLYSVKNVKNCLAVYRKHNPDISLPKSTLACFKRLSAFPKYIVTDGNKLVQAKKIESLGLTSKVKKVYITHRYGLKNSKPSPLCFTKICEREQTTPQHIVYIADNPVKDFVGIKPLGFRTIRILKGPFADKVFPKPKDADWSIRTLDELTPELLDRVFSV